MIRSISDLVKAVGGGVSAARIAGVRAANVTNWKTRGEIPAKHFPAFKAAMWERPPEELFSFKKRKPAEPAE